MYSNFSEKKSKKIIIYLLIFLILLLVTILFFYKQNSAIGRILIWENTIDIILQKLLLGWQNISFESQYMLQQASYFEKYPNSYYSLLADNVYHPFNELLLFLYQYGFVGFMFLTIVSYILYNQRNKNSMIHLLSIVSILIFGCFSYPLRYPFVWVILAFSLSQISSYSDNRVIYHRLHINFLCKILGFIIISIMLSLLIKDIKFEYRWNKTAYISLRGNTKSMMENYKELHHNWNGNPLFLYNYGAELNHIQEYQKSIQILSECISYWNDYDVQMILADNYFNLKKWELSKQSYELASRMCPNRFEPLYKLHQINIFQGRVQSARILAEKILSKDIKIPSYRIDFIKKEMNFFLQNHVNSFSGYELE